jgi:hypothetical protein
VISTIIIFEDDLFNVIGRKDLQQIQTLAKEQVRKSRIAKRIDEDCRRSDEVLLEEVTAVNQWAIKNIGLIDDYKGTS